MFFRTLSHVSDIDNYKIFSKSYPGLDQRVYNLPLVPQVATLWAQNDQSIGDTSRHIQI